MVPVARCNHAPLYTRSVANNNHEGREMTACMPAPAKSSTAARTSYVRPIRPEPQPAMPDKQLWKTDAARAFEAGIRWFLAVSRAA